MISHQTHGVRVHGLDRERVAAAVREWNADVEDEAAVLPVVVNDEQVLADVILVADLGPQGLIVVFACMDVVGDTDAVEGFIAYRDRRRRGEWELAQPGVQPHEIRPLDGWGPLAAATFLVAEIAAGEVSSREG